MVSQLSRTPSEQFVRCYLDLLCSAGGSKVCPSVGVIIVDLHNPYEKPPKIALSRHPTEAQLKARELVLGIFNAGFPLAIKKFVQREGAVPYLKDVVIPTGVQIFCAPLSQEEFSLGESFDAQITSSVEGGLPSPRGCHEEKTGFLYPDGSFVLDGRRWKITIKVKQESALSDKVAVEDAMRFIFYRVLIIEWLASKPSDS